MLNKKSTYNNFLTITVHLTYATMIVSQQRKKLKLAQYNLISFKLREKSNDDS